MKPVDLYIRQHRELAIQSQTLRAALRGPALENRAGEVRAQLSRFAGTLSVHLAMEDKQLYPLLANDERPSVADAAKRFALEMLPLASEVKDHSSRWQTKNIREDATSFVSSTTALLDRLAQRMSREEAELYPFFQ